MTEKQVDQQSQSALNQDANNEDQVQKDQKQLLSKQNLEQNAENGQNSEMDQAQLQHQNNSQSQIHKQLSPTKQSSMNDHVQNLSQANLEQEDKKQEANTEKNDQNPSQIKDSNNNLKEQTKISQHQLGTHNSLEELQNKISNQSTKQDLKNGEGAIKTQNSYLNKEKEGNLTNRKSKELPPLINEKFHKTGNSSTSHLSASKYSEGASLGRVLGEMKRNRKQAEIESAILSGRIALLKQEEINSRKKIFQTKKQTFEYYLLKKSNEELQNQKKKDQSEEQEKLKIKQEENERFRLKKRDDRDLARNEQLNTNKSHYNTVKKQLQEDEEKRKLYLERQALENQKKKMYIQQQLLKGSLRVTEYKNKQNERQLENYRKQIQEEEYLKQQKQYEIYQMEQLELSLIKKLQATQQIQRKCFEELQGVITLKTNEFKDQYKPVFSRKKVYKMIMSQTQQVLKQDDKIESATDRKMNTHQSLENLGAPIQAENKKINSQDKLNDIVNNQENTPSSKQQMPSSNENQSKDEQKTDNPDIQQERKQSQNDLNSNHVSSLQKSNLKITDGIEEEEQDKKKRKKSKSKKRKVKKIIKEYPDFVF
ncbi:hypothetical protein TTHERM_00939100 (macronuclear) [Tetrahymena thermophila SB210]|uniref:Uncharacterized protein n=1 Tax=Tetrahymena thermophila (strain SB210) TaxID=312017 RepID=Q22DN3_TETTS|nr:hypothetical protein TTHERM_00939100 [Tetrahymena thermophila SB210]EAR83421.1 hypothetical protein TTHERM_00939100 [Tetrahymena thermophila SB210]|eukprot:XP_001031084.1 hypothetical protein TTHERM_00939100 [Tetrahymena thermophila SB210]